MKITDFLSKSAIKINFQSRKKKDVIREMVDLLVQAGDVKKKARDEIIDAIFKREKIGSTGIGQGIAIPHAKSDKVESIVGAFGSSKEGIEFDALDGDPVHLIFLLMAPQEKAKLYLEALAKISRFLKDKFFRQALKEAKTPQEVMKTIEKEDRY